MLTNNEAPWVEYLVIDEQTRKRTLSADAPEDVKVAYEEYQKEMLKQLQSGKPIEK